VVCNQELGVSHSSTHATSHCMCAAAAACLRCRCYCRCYCYCYCRVGGVVAPFIIYAGEQLGLPKLPFALVGVLSVLTALMTALLPETKGKGQPDCMTDLQEMYGKPPSSTCVVPGFVTSSSAHGSTAKYPGSTDVTGALATEGSGLVQRLLSRASSNGSWLVGAIRSSGSFGGQQWEPVLPRDGSEVQLPLASVRTSDGVDPRL
jgi:hypothetical protein